jgi:hypothetical protein
MEGRPSVCDLLLCRSLNGNGLMGALCRIVALRLRGSQGLRAISILSTLALASSLGLRRSHTIGINRVVRTLTVPKIRMCKNWPSVCGVAHQLIGGVGRVERDGIVLICISVASLSSWIASVRCVVLVVLIERCWGCTLGMLMTSPRLGRWC